MQKYLVVIRMASDTSVWQPGSMIELDDARAAIHLAMGNVRPLDDTQAPSPPAPAVVVHEPVVVAAPPSPEGGAKKKAAKGDEG